MTVHTIDGYTADELLYGYFRQDGTTNGERIRITADEYHSKRKEKL